MNMRALSAAILAGALHFVIGTAWASDPFAKGLHAAERGDYETAKREFTLAVEQGDARGWFAIGDMYMMGLGVPRDFAEAAKSFRKGAEQGNAKAQGNLGFLYAAGIGIEKDLVEAFAWLDLAVAQGNEIDTRNRNSVARQLTSSQLQEAQALSREYFEKYVVPFRKGASR